MSKLPTEWDLLNTIWHIINQQVEEEILLSSEVQDEIETHIESHTAAHTAALDKYNSLLVEEKKVLQARVKKLESLMQEFVDRVDRGEVRSKKTYAKFKEALK